MPQVGDADDGRLHILGGYGSTTPQDARHLLGPAAAMFNEPAWLSLAGPAGIWEASWWGLGTGNCLALRSVRDVPAARAVSRLFPAAGLAVMRSDTGYVLVTNSVVGTMGFGNHKHNDQLSFEYHDLGVPLIVDPGSYVYTSDADARNMFRSTGYHNTVQIDSVEQNEMRAEWLFRLFETAKAEHVSFEERADAVEYVGRHHGYERLSDPVVHERKVSLQGSNALRIVDRFSGGADHDLRWHFHLAPGVDARVAGEDDPQTLVLSVSGRRWHFTIPRGLQVSIESAWYSPSYGVKVPCMAINLSTRTRLDADRRWEFCVQPKRGPGDP
jgi:hypothetical protein